MSYPKFTREELIADWFKRSQKEGTEEFTIFDQFMSLWLAFNAWGTYESKEGKDFQMLSWIKAKTNLPSIHSKLMKGDADY